MVPGIPSTAQIEVVPVTAERWLALETRGGTMGIASVFRALGFVEVAQASETQRIMRYLV